MGISFPWVISGTKNKINQSIHFWWTWATPISGNAKLLARLLDPLIQYLPVVFPVGLPLIICLFPCQRKGSSKKSQGTTNSTNPIRPIQQNPINQPPWALRGATCDSPTSTAETTQGCNQGNAISIRYVVHISPVATINNGEHSEFKHAWNVHERLSLAYPTNIMYNQGSVRAPLKHRDCPACVSDEPVWERIHEIDWHGLEKWSMGNIGEWQRLWNVFLVLTCWPWSRGHPPWSKENGIREALANGTQQNHVAARPFQHVKDEKNLDPHGETCQTLFYHVLSVWKRLGSKNFA